MLGDDDLLDRIAESIVELQKRENITLPMLRKQLAEVEQGIENMLNAIQQGILNKSTKKRFDELEDSKADIEVKILCEEMERPLLTKEQILFWLHRFRSVDITKREQRQMLIDIFISAVYLYDDRLVLLFNNKEGAKNVTMAEIEENFRSDLTASGSPRENPAFATYHSEWTTTWSDASAFKRLQIYNYCICLENRVYSTLKRYREK